MIAAFIAGSWISGGCTNAGGAENTTLNPTLTDCAALGFERCAVDFESFNPGTARFWMKYFDPVAYSLMRRPEAL